MADRDKSVLLVGSLALADADEVFREVGDRLGHLVAAIPDGETGERASWVGLQFRRLNLVKGLQKHSEHAYGGDHPQSIPTFKYKPGYSAANLDIGRFGYDELALASYEAFKKARAEGHIREGVRFQVSIPTAVALANAIQEPLEEHLPLFERQMIEELKRIQTSIPARDLAVQWDIAIEIEQEEAARHPENAPPMGPPRQTLTDAAASIGRISAAISEEVSLGAHLCYGDPDGKHIIEPVDLTVPVDMSNALFDAVGRRIDWIHMPVPIGRVDEAYFIPLAKLRKPAATRIYLGVLHLADGVEGAQRRMAMAKKFLPEFGIATECGLGRRRREIIPDLLELHRQVAEG